MNKLIVDTDIGQDCDDVCALVVLLELQRRGEIEVLAITNCTSSHWSSYSIAYICE